MRTAVVRVDVDPSAELTPAQLGTGLAALSALAAEAGATVIRVDLAHLPPGRRHVEVLVDGDDADELRRVVLDSCTAAFGGFGVAPVVGVLTYTSRGTDDDAHGVLAALGLRGDISRTATAAGWDLVEVTLRADDLRRVPESRVHTALEASLNCEVRIVTV